MSGIEFCKAPSMELSWISKTSKQTPMPQIAYIGSLQYSGVYLRPSQNETIQFGAVIPPHNGAILVGDFESFGMPIPATIAHEWRHHWQYFNGWKFDNIGWRFQEDYQSEIRDYFMSSKIEMDALLFELKHVPCDENKWRHSVCR